MQSPEHQPPESASRSLNSQSSSVGGIPRLAGSVPPIPVMPPLPAGMPPLPKMPPIPDRLPPPLSESLSDLRDLAPPLDQVQSAVNQPIEHSNEIVELAVGGRSGGNVTEITTSEAEIEQIKHSVEQLTTVASLLKELANLRKQLRPYQASDPAETWASRWIASLIAYLLAEPAREALLGDLYEANREMLRRNYPRWFVNVNNILIAIGLIESGLRQKLQEWLSVWKQMK